MKVLIADDDQSIIDDAIELFGESCQVSTATTQTEALDIFRENAQGLDIFILDGSMPGTSFNTKEIVGEVARSHTFGGILVAHSCFWSIEMLKIGCHIAINKGKPEQPSWLMSATTRALKACGNDWNELRHRIMAASLEERYYGIALLQEITDRA